MDGNEGEEGFASRGPEKRACSRYSVDEDSVLLLVNHGMPVKARIVDVSLEGCRVRTSDRFTGKAGRPVEITFKVKGFAFRFSGVVRWTDGQHMLGIHFENMIPRRKAELIEVIEEMAAASAARAQAVDQMVGEQEASTPALAKAANTITAKPVAPETAKASAPTVSAKAIEPSSPPRIEKAETPSEAEPATPRPKPRDRRGQSRHEVDTRATIVLIRVGSELGGRILDLSVGGCRIRTDERFPVGIYTRVETEFHLQGLSFRLGGVIQAIHNRDTVGIRFLDLSDRKRQQVMDLINEMEQMRAATPQDETLAAKEQAPAENR